MDRRVSNVCPGLCLYKKRTKRSGFRVLGFGVFVICLFSSLVAWTALGIRAPDPGRDSHIDGGGGRGGGGSGLFWGFGFNEGCEV